MPDLQTFGVIAFATLLPLGLALCIWGRFHRAGTVKARLIFLGWTLMGIGSVCFAMTDLSAIYTSDKVTTQGSIYALRKINSGKDHSSYFCIQNNQRPPQLSIDYAGPRMQNGEQALVTYLSNTTNVTDLRILSGPDTGWTDHEGNGTISDVVMFGLGSLFVFVGFYMRHKHPDGTTPVSKDNKNPITDSAGKEFPRALNDR